nr:MAG TPA: hypothetical protein [Caudoviricetes sp.]
MENGLDNMYSDRILVAAILHIVKELMYVLRQCRNYYG